MCRIGPQRLLLLRSGRSAVDTGEVSQSESDCVPWIVVNLRGLRGRCGGPPGCLYLSVESCSGNLDPTMDGSCVPRVCVVREIGEVDSGERRVGTVHGLVGDV